MLYRVHPNSEITIEIPVDSKDNKNVNLGKFTLE